MSIRFLSVATFLVALAALVSGQADAQAVKGSISADDPLPALQYHGLVPGLSTTKAVREAIGDPFFAARWYSYKMYYHAKDRPGLVDVLHMHGNSPDAGLAEVEAASVPEGYETGTKIRAALGKPEYELRMPTWSLLDYGEKGVRFALSAEGNTIGVAYVPHLYRRVPEGERALVDMSRLREGPQSRPEHPASVSGLQVGASEVSISPTGEDWLGHPYTVHDDLMARIAVFRKDGLTVAFVGNDLFGMGFDNVQVMRDAAIEMGIDHMIFAMSHNHAAGDTIGIYGHYPAEYIAHIQAQVKDGLEEALANLAPVKELRVASKELPMDGIRVQDLFRNARNPGLLDPTISLVQAIGEDGAVITTMVHFACHTESLKAGAREVSADFPGYMCEQIKKDGGGQAVFLNGALGGMISGDNRERTHESSRDMGLRLAKIVNDLETTAQPPATFSFSADRRDLYIPMSNPNFDALYETGLRKLHRGRTLTDMTYIRLGEAQFISLPGELLPEVSFEILAEMKGFPRVLIGLANDQIGYMVPPYDFRDDYYEETMSQGPATAVQVRDMALRMIRGN